MNIDENKSTNITESIKKPHLILCEGKDDFLFICYYLRYLIEKDGETFETFQAFEGKGIENMPKQLESIMNMEGYDNIVKSITIIRDAEQDAEKAIQEVKSMLKKYELPIPAAPNEIANSDKKKISFTLFPILSERVEKGTLEDLCIEILSEKEEKALAEIDNFIKSIRIIRGREFSRIHKNRLHTYFSATDKYVGLKIGEAAKAGAFLFESARLNGLKSLLTLMCSV